MLSKRIIACLDVRDGQVVKGVNFEGLRSAGDPAELARRYNVEGIDELVILDVTATILKLAGATAGLQGDGVDLRNVGKQSGPDVHIEHRPDCHARHFRRARQRAQLVTVMSRLTQNLHCSS